MPRPLSQVQILRALQPRIEQNLARHMSATTEWHLGDHEPAGITPLPAVARSAMIVSMLTTPTPPSHHAVVGRGATKDPWTTWLDRWTEAKHRHIAFLREQLVVAGGVDPAALERARTQTMPVGIDSFLEGAALLHWATHVTLQEMAAAVSHRNTAAMCGDTSVRGGLTRIAADDDLHMRFHLDLCAAAFDLAPDQTIKSVADVVMNFQMPGSTIPSIRHHTALVRAHRIYDHRRHVEEVIRPVLRHWNIFERNDFTAAGERVRDRIASFVDTLDAGRTACPVLVG